MSSLPTITPKDINEDTFYGTYSDFESLLIAINSEIDGLNIFKVLNEEGKVQNYTFEVPE